MKRVSLLFVVNLLLFTSSFSQVAYTIDDGSVMTITGTSTIHDWTSKVNEIKGEYILKEAIVNKKIPQSGSILEKVKVIVPVLSIESPRGTIMDKKTYNALKSEQYPNLVFEAKADNIENITDKAEAKFLLKVTGDLTLAGYTKEIILSVEGQKLASGKFEFKGSYPIDMVEYNIEPPTAMFGQIITGKDVTIDFDLILNRQ